MTKESVDIGELERSVKKLLCVVRMFINLDLNKKHDIQLSFAYEFFNDQDLSNDLLKSLVTSWKKLSSKKKSYSGIKKRELEILEWYLYQEIIDVTVTIEGLLGRFKDLDKELQKVDELNKRTFSKLNVNQIRIGINPDFIKLIKDIKTDEEVKEEVFKTNEQIRSNIASILETLFSSLKELLGLKWLEIPIEIFSMMKLPRFNK